jgi:hypothetical protein
MKINPMNDYETKFKEAFQKGYVLGTKHAFFIFIPFLVYFFVMYFIIN